MTKKKRKKKQLHLFVKNPVIFLFGLPMKIPP